MSRNFAYWSSNCAIGAQYLPQILLKPLHSLQESRLLGIFLLAFEFASNGEAMHDSGIQVDLIWLLGLFKNLF